MDLQQEIGLRAGRRWNLESLLVPHAFIDQKVVNLSVRTIGFIQRDPLCKKKAITEYCRVTSKIARKLRLLSKQTIWPSSL